MALQLGNGPLGRMMGIGLTIAIAVGAWFLWDKGQEKVAEANAPEVGTCLEFPTGDPDAEGEEVDCGDAGATYKVVSDDGKCDAVEDTYTISIGDDADDAGNVAELCLDLNAQEGDCFRSDGASSEQKVDCSTQGRQVARVVAVGDQAAGRCPKGSQPFRNKTRDTLICLGPNA